MKLQFDLQFFTSILFIGFVALLFRLYNSLVQKPNVLRSKLRKQGISGPPPTILLGNLMDIIKSQLSTSNSPSFEPPLLTHNTASLIFPKFEEWREQYGKVFMFSFGNIQTLCVNQTDIVKEITTCTSFNFGKASFQKKLFGPLLGDGIITSNGTTWAHHRKMLQNFTWIRLRYLPTNNNIKAWKLEKEVKSLILEVVKERKEKTSVEKDLLQMVIEGVKQSNLTQEANDRFIIDNCKNIYLAGFESTAVVASWCLMLLASNQTWQDRARAEVLEICNGRIPDFDMISKMKLVTMIIHESLRLYPPVPLLPRHALNDMKFGNIDVPKGTGLWILILSLHTNPDIWGDDAYKFNPGRFANGTACACKHPHVYKPFGVGPRVCLGQNLAMLELKMLIALILSNFSFSLSPRYIHSPAFGLILKPDHGVQLLLRKL